MPDIGLPETCLCLLLTGAEGPPFLSPGPPSRLISLLDFRLSTELGSLSESEPLELPVLLPLELPELSLLLSLLSDSLSSLSLSLSDPCIRRHRALIFSLVFGCSGGSFFEYLSCGSTSCAPLGLTGGGCEKSSLWPLYPLPLPLPRPQPRPFPCPLGGKYLPRLKWRSCSMP